MAWEDRAVQVGGLATALEDRAVLNSVWVTAPAIKSNLAFHVLPCTQALQMLD